MEETCTTTAIILKRAAFREKDSRLQFYSQDYGLVAAVARGTKKITSKLAGHLEPFNLANLMIVRGRQYDYIGGAVCQQAYPEIKSSYDTAVIAGQGVRVFLNQVKAGERDADLFLLLKDYLDFLETRTIKIDFEFIFYLFVFKLMSHLGYQPILNKCLDGGEGVAAGNNFFDIERGGLVCARHNSNNSLCPISQDSLAILRAAKTERLPQLNDLKLNSEQNRELKRIIKSYSQYHGI